MSNKFDSEEAKNFLLTKEEREKQQREDERTSLLAKVISILETEFKGSPVEVYLVGSILKPFGFSSRSDVDIVLKNYKDDRFELWANLERTLDRKVEVILFERCPFQEFVLKEGYRVV